MSEIGRRTVVGDVARVTLGASLARLRHHYGITGQELGRRAGISQAKVSKMENGLVAPTARDVERYARAAGASEEEITNLVELADSLYDQVTDWRVTSKRLVGSQSDLGQLEAKATTIRIFQPGVLSGLVQTAEYARAVLGGYLREVSENPAAAGPGVPAAVSARIKRQEVLADRTKAFRFIIPETALLHQVCPPTEMASQISRLREIAGYDNVTVGIIPIHAPMSYPPVHGFSLMDDRVVLVDLINTSVTTRGRYDVAFYRRVFDSLEQNTTTDIDAILEKHLQDYLNLASSSPSID